MKRGTPASCPRLPGRGDPALVLAAGEGGKGLGARRPAQNPEFGRTNRLFSFFQKELCKKNWKKHLSLSIFPAMSGKIDPDWLLSQTGKENATCTLCTMVLEEATLGCPEGHVFCRECYLTWLDPTKQESTGTCPTCRHPTNASRLQRCPRQFEDFIAQQRCRCKYGPEQDEGVGGGGADPSPKRAKLGPAESSSADDLPDGLGCKWKGRVCELAAHLATTCDYEPVGCAAGCTELVPRKDASSHASESCSKTQIECPNAGCGVMAARGSMEDHRAVCLREEVECPCPGCDERVARAEVDAHVEVSRALHERCAWTKVAEQGTTIARLKQANRHLQKKVAAQAITISELSDQGDDTVATVDEMNERIAEMDDELKENTSEIESLLPEVEMQGALITGLQNAEVFTWSTDTEWSTKKSAHHTFARGIRGGCVNIKPRPDEDKNFMGFILVQGPVCTMHYK